MTERPPDAAVTPPGVDGYTPPPPPPPPAGILEIEPADAQLAVTGGVAATLDYTATLHHNDGTDEDVTIETTFSVLNPALGSFSGRRFTSATDHGGRTEVFGTARGLSASATLTVRLTEVIIEPGLPPDAPLAFGGTPDPSRAPTVVYPPDGVLVPPNLNELEFHFLPGNGNTLFELAFVGDALNLKVYFACTAVGGGCAWMPSEAVWSTLAEAGRGMAPLAYVLRGVDGASPGGVGVAAERAIGFGQQNIDGGLYYWNAGAGAVRRYDFGRRGQVAENFMDQARAGAALCVGCHVLSRDGKKVAVGLDMPAPSPYKVFDVATRTLTYAGATGSNFFSFSPDGTTILTSNGVTTDWRQANDGTALAEPLLAVGTMPDWAASGQAMVYARSQQPPPCLPGMCGAPGIDKGALELLPFDGAGWGTATTLVPYQGQNNYYPSFAPSSQWVVFNRSPSDQNSYDAPDAQVWVVAAAGGTPIQLAAASTGGDSWPKWAPDVQDYRGGRLMWLTFSSRRAYGLRIGAGSVAQIWMTAFDPGRAAAGQDPSYPAFWLPFQEPGSGNHIAQWVTHVERQPCDPGDCPTGEFCEEGYCVPVVQ